MDKYSFEIHFIVKNENFKYVSDKIKGGFIFYNGFDFEADQRFSPSRMASDITIRGAFKDEFSRGRFLDSYFILGRENRIETYGTILNTEVNAKETALAKIALNSFYGTKACDDTNYHVLPTKIQKEWQKAMMDIIRKDMNISGGRDPYYVITSRGNGKSLFAATWQERLYENLFKERVNTMKNIPDISKIVVNGPATIGFFNKYMNGDVRFKPKKVIIKLSKHDNFDPEKAVLLLMVKSMFPDEASFHSWMRRQMKTMNQAMNDGIEKAKKKHKSVLKPTHIIPDTSSHVMPDMSGMGDAAEKKKSGKRWTESEMKTVAKAYLRNWGTDIMSSMVCRSESSIKSKIHQMGNWGVFKGSTINMTDEKIDKLVDDWFDSNRDLAWFKRFIKKR